MSEGVNRVALQATDIENTKNVIKTYITNCKEKLNAVNNEVTTLCQEGFIGDASTGYQTFVNQYLTKIDQELLSGEEAVLQQLIKVLDSVQKALLDDVDPSLKKQNVGLLSQEGK